MRKIISKAIQQFNIQHVFYGNNENNIICGIQHTGNPRFADGAFQRPERGTISIHTLSFLAPVALNAAYRPLRLCTDTPVGAMHPSVR